MSRIHRLEPKTDQERQIQFLAEALEAARQGRLICHVAILVVEGADDGKPGMVTQTSQRGPGEFALDTVNMGIDVLKQRLVAAWGGTATHLVDSAVDWRPEKAHKRDQDGGAESEAPEISV